MRIPLRQGRSRSKSFSYDDLLLQYIWCGRDNSVPSGDNRMYYVNLCDSADECKSKSFACLVVNGQETKSFGTMKNISYDGKQRDVL